MEVYKNIVQSNEKNKGISFDRFRDNACNAVCERIVFENIFLVVKY